MTVEIKCRKCGKQFIFDTDSTGKSLVQEFADGAKEKWVYFPKCPSCGHRHDVSPKVKD